MSYVWETFGQLAVETKCYQSCVYHIAVCGPYDMSTVTDAVLTYQQTTRTTSVNMDVMMDVSPNLEPVTHCRLEYNRPSEQGYTDPPPQKKINSGGHFKSLGTIRVDNCAFLGYFAASRDNSLPTFRGTLSVPSCRILEDGTDSLSRNVGKELPLYAA
jgi:hypothetical protein